MSLTLFTAIFAAPSAAQANFTFAVFQDVSALFGSGSPPGPFYLGLNLNSADNGGSNNLAYVHWNNDLAKGISLVGSSTVVQGNAIGDLTGMGLLTMSEGGASKLGDSTQVLQKLSIDSPLAVIGFQVEVTDNYVGPSNLYAPDTFTYQLLYDDPNNPGTLIPVVTDLVPGNIDFVQYSFQVGSVPTSGAPLAGFNPSPLDGIGPAFIIPEPASVIVWGAMLAGLWTYRRRRV